MEELIKKTYLDPELSSYSVNKLYLKLKDKGVTMKMIKEFLKKKKRDTTNIFKNNTY